MGGGQSHDAAMLAVAEKREAQLKAFIRSKGLQVPAKPKPKSHVPAVMSNKEKRERARNAKNRAAAQQFQGKAEALKVQQKKLGIGDPRNKTTMLGSKKRAHPTAMTHSGKRHKKGGRRKRKRRA
jgi:hypothetical protein